MHNSVLILDFFVFFHFIVYVEDVEAIRIYFDFSHVC